MKRLDNKIAIITGAVHGIGLAAARLFAAEGAAVVVGDIDGPNGEKVVDEIRNSGGKAAFVYTDVSKEKDMERLFGETLSLFGDLDIMYNNAGFEEYFVLHELSEESWERQIDINLKGTFLGSKHAVRYFMKKEKGVILNTSSIAGFFPTPDRPAYNAAKGGLITLTRNIAMEYGKYNIRANVICPGVIHTRMTMGTHKNQELVVKAGSASVLNRIGQPEEVAKAALFLVSDDASYITGTCLFVDGGMSMGGFWRRQ